MIVLSPLLVEKSEKKNQIQFELSKYLLYSIQHIEI